MPLATSKIIVAASSAEDDALVSSEPPNRLRLSLVAVKILMAITGAGLLTFVTMHMLGNLQIYLGQDAINAYAAKLKSMPVLLWSARLGLLLIFTAHIGLAIYLKRINRRARPRDYCVKDPIETTVASRTMMSSGLVILAFTTYHLLHFTLGITEPANHHLTDAAGRHDVYSMVVMGFQNIYVAAAYIAAMLFLGLHLSHAASSIFQTLGLTSTRNRPLLHRAGIGLAMLIMLGNISIPVSVLLGLLGLPNEGVTP